MTMTHSAIYKQRVEAITKLSDQLKTLSHRAQARLLHKTYPCFFSTLESARQFIQRMHSMAGGLYREKMSLQAHEDAKKLLPHAKAELPPVVVEQEWTPYQLPDIGGVWLMLADVHMPFYDRRALEAAVSYAKGRVGKNLRGIILNGDISDQYCNSWFAIDPLTTNHDTELQAMRCFLLWLKKELPGRKIVWKKANHEARFEKTFINNNKSQAASKDWRMAMTLENMLANVANPTVLDGVDIVDDGQMMYHRELAILHGDEISKGAAIMVNPARSAFLKTKSIVIVAHSHQSSSHGESDIWGRQLSAWSMGCLCNLHPKWNRMASLKWNHGFTLLDVRGTWEIENKKVLEGGKVVAA